MKRKILAVFLIGGGAALLAIGLMAFAALDGVEGATWAWRARALAEPEAASARIRVILLDQASLDWGAREKALPWPWPREVYGAILDFCRRGGARAVAFDVLFTEPSYMGTRDDEALAEAVARTPGFVAALFLRPEGDPPRDPDLLRLGPLAEDSRGLPVFRSAQLPVPEVFQAAPFFGNVSALPDPDGIFRRISPLSFIGGRQVPALGLAAFTAGNPDEAVRISSSRRWLHVGERKIPLDSRGHAILRYRGVSGTHKTYNAAAIIESELRILEGAEPLIDPEDLRDTYVLFGFSAPGLLDLRPTPVSRVYPGVEIHATLLDNILEAAALREPRRETVAGVLVLFSLAGVAWLLALRRPGHTALVCCVLPAAPVAASFAAYAGGWAWPMAGPVAAALAAIGGALLYQYATEGRQKAFIKSAFRHYLSPAVIDRILEDPSQLKLGGERRELSIFFSDLQGFSSLSEKLDPTDLTALLNDYLSDMTDIILEEGGTLDKYEGDAIIAFWNAPLFLPDHAARALRAGLRCQRRLAERRQEFLARSGVELRMRIGIHTGDVVVGNMGSRARFDYSMLGDAANLASRLEGANKAFGTYFMVSEATWSAAGNGFAGRELGRLRVVGRKTPVRVFEPFGWTETPPPSFAGRFADGLVLFYKGDYNAAADVFEALAAEDPAAAAYARRCRSPAPADAEPGIWTLDAK